MYLIRGAYLTRGAAGAYSGREAYASGSAAILVSNIGAAVTVIGAEYLGRGAYAGREMYVSGSAAIFVSNSGAAATIREESKSERKIDAGVEDTNSVLMIGPEVTDAMMGSETKFLEATIVGWSSYTTWSLQALVSRISPVAASFELYA